MAEQVLMSAANAIETELDAALESLSVIDDKDLQEIERKRVEEYKKEVNQRNEYIKKGHLEYSEIPSEKDFFEVAKKSEFFACHFYRPSTMRCSIVDKHFSLLAPKHIETKFCKINAEKSPFLCGRLNINVLPTILLCKNGVTVDKIVGFTELGGVDDFSTDELAWAISKRGVLKYSGRPPASVVQAGAQKIQLAIQGKPMIKNIRETTYDSDDD